MNKVAGMILASVSALACGGVWAVEPVAVWNGFSNLTPAEGYGLVAGEDVVGSDGIATIANGKTLKLTKDMGNQFTVVMEVSDVPGATGSGFITILDAFYANSAAHLTLDSQEGKLMHKWSHDSRDFGTVSKATPISGRNVIAFAYNSTSGEKTYVNGVQVVSGGAYSSARVNRFCFGGYWGDTPTCTANGLKIYRIELYDTQLSADEIAEIKCSTSAAAGSDYVCSNLDRAETKSSHYTQSANVSFILPPSGDCPAGTVVAVSTVKLGSPAGKSMANAVTLAGQSGTKGSAETSSTTGFTYVQPYTFSPAVEIEVGKTYTFNAGGSQCTGINGASPIAGNNMASYNVYCSVEGTVKSVIRKGTVSGDCTIESVTWANGAPSEGDIVELNVTDDATLTLDAAVKFASLKMTGDGALTISDLTNLGSTPIEGDGTIVFDGTMPPDSAKTSFRSEKWTGTVWVKNITASAERSPTMMGHANSTVRFTNVTGWMATAMNFAGTVEIIDDENGNGLTIDNGSSGWQENRVVRFGHLKGTGTLKLSWGRTYPLHLPDVSAFTGSINCANASGIGVIIGATASLSDGASGSVTILEGATARMAADRPWAFTSGKGIKGAGRLVIEGNAPTEFTTDPVVTLESSWTGTVELKDMIKNTAQANNWGVIQLNKYGNANSTVAFNNVTMTAYAVGNSNNGNTAENNVGAYEVMAGGWNLRHGPFSSTDVYRGDLKGSGTINVTAYGSRHGQIVFCGNPEGFTGTITHGTQAGTKRVVFLADKDASAPADSTDYMTVFFGDGVTLPNLTTASPVKFGGSVVVKVDSVPPALEGTKVLTHAEASEASLDVQVTAQIDGTESSAYSLYQKTDGIYLIQLDKVVWAGASGAALTDEGAWTDGADYGEKAAEGVFEFPANEANCVVMVKADTADANVFLVEGAYTLKGEGSDVSLSLNTLSLAATATLKLENLTLRVPSLANEKLAQITFGNGARLELDSAPSFTASAVLNVSDVDQLDDGAYEILAWGGKIPSGRSGYGRPTANLGAPKEGYDAKLVYQVHGVSLLVRDPAHIARKPLTIWPFGDSITEGMNAGQTHANYRIQLYQKLELLGYNVQSVGFSTRTYGQRGAYDPTGADISDQRPEWIRHSGVGGELACHYTANHGTLHDSWANALDQAGDPDIVLIHIGINDIVSGDANAAKRWVETFGSVTNMAANILRERPNTKVVLSSMHRLEWGQTFQTASNNGNGNYVKPFRDAMAALMVKIDAGEVAELPKGRVFFADMYDKVRPRSFADFQDGENEENGLFESDHIHPNWEGHDRMSDCWLEQIVAAFPDATDDSSYHAQGTPAAVPAEKLGAAQNVPADYLKGFKQATVVTPAADGTERASTITVNQILDGTKAVEKVGYYVEYVFPSATTNIHRWVWVDMDSFKENMTVADAGLPTAGTTQKVVSKLHVASNHQAIHAVAADDDSVNGFIEFSPSSFGGDGGVAGGPTHWMNNSSWNDYFGVGSYGSMQLHRMAPGANPYDPNSTPPAEVLFAYNAWNCNDSKPTEFGIGDFNQHYQGYTIDWVGTRNTETMHAGCLTAKSIEIWVKVAGDDEPVVVDPAKDAVVVEAADATEALSKVVLEVSDADAASAGQAAVLMLVAVPVEGQSGQWSVGVAIDTDRMAEGKKIEDTLRAFGENGLSDVAESETEIEVTIPAGSVTPGLYYSVLMSSRIDFAESTETARVLACPDRPVVLKVPHPSGQSCFFRMSANMTKE